MLLILSPTVKQKKESKTNDNQPTRVIGKRMNIQKGKVTPT